MSSWTPSKGGDGGAVPRKIKFDARRPQQHDNRCVKPTGAPDADLAPTAYPYDRAHFVKGPDGRLLNARQVPNAQPRRYPRSALNAAGVTFEAAFDETERIRRQLEDAGIPGFEALPSPWSVALDKMRARQFRDLTRRKTR